jgi:hypothetical protein
METMHGLRLDFQSLGLQIHNTIIYTTRRMQNPPMQYTLLTDWRNSSQCLQHVVEIPELLENNNIVSEL